MKISPRFAALAVLALFLVHPLFPQDKRTFRQMFKEAESILLYLNEENEALKLFLELDRMDPGNAQIQYKIGLCYLHLPGEKEKAIPYFREACKHTSADYQPVYDERNAPRDAFFYLALAYHVNNRFDEAIDAYNKFIEVADVSSYYDVEFVREQINGCLQAREMVNNPVPYEETLLDGAVNASPITFNPAVSGNGKAMVYTVREGDFFRIFYTTRTEKGWRKPVEITDDLDTRGDGVSSSLSQDGSTLFVYRDDGGAGDLYVSHLEKGKWTPLVRLNRNINTKYWESACCLSPDGQTLYFSSNRKGGYGKLDLYQSERMPDGDWGPARNLGPVINSPLMEDAPHMTSNGNILFFSSHGHSSMGGFDHFYSSLTASGSWSLPVNLGYPVSTTDDDLFLAPVGQGDTAYYAHFGKTSPPREGIYRVILREEEPEPLASGQETVVVLPEITLKGKVKLQDNNQAMDTTVRISVVDTVSGKVVKTMAPDPQTGEYEMKLPAGNYQLVYEASGYEKQAQEITVAENIRNRDVRVNTRLVPEEVTRGKYLMIENIYFDFDSYSLDKEAEMRLEKLAAIMHEYPMLEFELIGHTDTVGSQAYNLVLSRRRANTVALYLFDKGIERNRLLTKGVGEIIAIRKGDESATSGEDPRLYRRVEVKVLKAEPGMEIREEGVLPEYMRPKLDLNYTVIVLKVKERLPDDYFDSYDIEELRFIREQEVSDGYIYTLGSFPQKQKAVELLGTLREVGFREATVVDQHELADIVVGEDPEIGFIGQPERIDDIPWYTIQIFALKNPPHPSAFRGRKDILEFPCQDGFIHYCVGKYKGYSNALKALPQVRKEWYKDAFIQELDRLEKGIAE